MINQTIGRPYPGCGCPERGPSIAARVKGWLAELAADGGRAARALATHRRELHLIAWRAPKLLWTVRKAFPWPLRILAMVGCVQIPILPTDEIAAGIALVWIVARYRPLAKVLWHAAVLEVAR